MPVLSSIHSTFLTLSTLSTVPYVYTRLRLVAGPEVKYTNSTDKKLTRVVIRYTNLTWGTGRH